MARALSQLSADWLRVGLNGLQLGLAAFAVLRCFQGRGQPFLWCAVALALPLLRLALSASFREHLLALSRTWWREAEAYPASHSLPWRAALAFVVLPAALLYLSSGHSVASDSTPVLLTVHSIFTERDLDLDEYVAQLPAAIRDEPEGMVAKMVHHRGHYYSPYPSGMLQFAVPVVAVSRLVGADLDNERVRTRLEKWTSVWVSGLGLTLFFFVALHLAPARAAWATTLLLGVGSVMTTVVGDALWQHGGVIVWALVLLLVEFRRGQDWDKGGLFLQGVAVAMMAACRLSSALFLLPFGLWLLLRAPRRTLALGVIAAVCYQPWAALYLAAYGSPFGPSTGQLSPWLWTLDVSQSLPAVLVGPFRGLFVYQPWLLLALLGLVPAVRRAFPTSATEPKGWQWPCLAMLLLQVAMTVTWWCWWGGHCWGSRLLAESIPIVALLCVRPVAWLLTHSLGRWLFGGIVLLSFYPHAVGLYSPQKGSVLEVQYNPVLLHDWARCPLWPGNWGR